VGENESVRVRVRVQTTVVPAGVSLLYLPVPRLKVSNTTLLFIFTVAALNHVPHFLCAGRPGTWKSFRAADRATEDLNGGAGESNRMARL